MELKKDHSRRLTKVQSKVSSALSMFTKAKEQMVEAKNQLEETVVNIDNEIEELQLVKNNAVGELGSYDRLINKLNEFTL